MVNGGLRLCTNCGCKEVTHVGTPRKPRHPKACARETCACEYFCPFRQRKPPKRRPNVEADLARGWFNRRFQGQR